MTISTTLKCFTNIKFKIVTTNLKKNYQLFLITKLKEKPPFND